MSFMTIKKCCCCGLRTGCFIIAYYTLLEKIIGLGAVSYTLSNINSNLVKYNHYALLHEQLGISKMILSFKILLLSFEILLCIALLNGLYKKIQDQIQMYYVGGAFFFVLKLILMIIETMRFAPLMKKHYDFGNWILYAAEVGAIALNLYFFAIIRSYNYELKKDYKKMNMQNNFNNGLKA